MTHDFDQCPELEQLFTELEQGEGPALQHAYGCEACRMVLEEHRQLEKDLYRLADPLPPPSLVMNVMARVAQEPAPVHRELWTALPILLVTLVAGLGLILSNDALLSRVSVSVAAVFTKAGTFLGALNTGMDALWATAAVPVAIGAFLVLVLPLLGLKRLAGPLPTTSEA
ncbi:hypothetical protein FGE12_01020 [Aggregicoccus sp. 17bor-14]|uniref:hypothetical protein n=1 Tax=Myxococcaceae TaxID=31 RepID=UPI00129C7123|nr:MULTISPECIES: hypothetical protein [Myxococcaceae]MBF5040954.1 hypothetical protein [Simulacricoccus sp. 17bor-14]MRI86742.1 hypothetical protein [Aggregicoccus sp. 17bor-14]